MTRWLLTILVCAACQMVDNSLAWEIPYGVQDPMLGSAGFMNCAGGEIGYWNIIQRKSSDGKQTIVYLILTTVDLADPAFVICVVPPERKVLIMDPSKGT